MDLEQMKEFMIETFRKFEEVDPEKSPHLYFTKELQKHLEVLERETRNTGLVSVRAFGIANKIVSNLPVDISGLGINYEDHKEFLDKLSYIATPILFKIWLACEKISETYAINVIKEIKITMR